MEERIWADKRSEYMQRVNQAGALTILVATAGILKYAFDKVNCEKK